MINLASKYSGKIATAFTHASFVKGKCGNAYDFTGVKEIKVYTPLTVDEGDYQRSGANRYGVPVEMQDTVQEMTVTQDKSFALTIDKGNAKDQMNVKKAGEMLQLQLREKSTPAADKYALSRFARMAGQTLKVAAKPTKTTVVGFFADMSQKFDDALVPPDGRFAWITAELFTVIAMSDEFIKLEALGVKSVSRGEVGELFGFRLIKVPTSYLPENCYAICAVKNALLYPYKIQDAKVHQDPPGLSGDLIEGRHYYDAFVLGAKCDGVGVMVLSSAVQADPAIAIASNKATVTSAGAENIRCTLDGSDPRYSDSAKTYPSGGVTMAAGETIRAVAFGAAGKFTSAVTKAENE